MYAHRDTSTIQIGINYPGSRLAVGNRDNSSKVRAAARAPEATGLVTLEGNRHPFDILCETRFTLLSCGSPESFQQSDSEINVASVARAVASPNEVVDTNRSLSEAYETTSSTFVLIRPDDYTGMITDSRDVDALQSYMSNFR